MKNKRKIKILNIRYFRKTLIDFSRDMIFGFVSYVFRRIEYYLFIHVFSWEAVYFTFQKFQGLLISSENENGSRSFEVNVKMKRIGLFTRWWTHHVVCWWWRRRCAAEGRGSSSTSGITQRTPRQLTGSTHSHNGPLYT